MLHCETLDVTVESENLVCHLCMPVLHFARKEFQKGNNSFSNARRRGTWSRIWHQISLKLNRWQIS